MESLQFYLFIHSIFGLTITGKEHFLTGQIGKIYVSFYFTTPVRSYIDCVSMCTNENQCGAANFNTASSQCQLIDVFYTTTQTPLSVGETWIVTEKEKSIGKDCSEAPDCWEANSVCIAHKCFCTHTSVYNATTKSCDTKCSVPAEDYLKVDRRNIGGHNFAAFNNKTVAECTSICDQFGMFFGSFEYLNGEGKCQMNYVTLQQIQDANPDALINNTGHPDYDIDLYTKQCSPDE